MNIPPALSKVKPQLQKPTPRERRKRKAARLATLRQARSERLRFTLSRKGWDYDQMMGL